MRQTLESSDRVQILNYVTIQKTGALHTVRDKKKTLCWDQCGEIFLLHAVNGSEKGMRDPDAQCMETEVIYWDRQKSRSECKGSVARRSEISQDKIVRQKGSGREHKLEVKTRKSIRQ